MKRKNELNSITPNKNRKPPKLKQRPNGNWNLKYQTKNQMKIIHAYTDYTHKNKNVTKSSNWQIQFSPKNPRRNFWNRAWKRTESNPNTTIRRVGRGQEKSLNSHAGATNSVTGAPQKRSVHTLSSSPPSLYWEDRRPVHAPLQSLRGHWPEVVADVTHIAPTGLLRRGALRLGDVSGKVAWGARGGVWISEIFYSIIYQERLCLTCHGSWLCSQGRPKRLVGPTHDTPFLCLLFFGISCVCSFIPHFASEF